LFFSPTASLPDGLRLHTEPFGKAIAELVEMPSDVVKLLLPGVRIDAQQFRKIGGGQGEPCQVEAPRLGHEADRGFDGADLALWPLSLRADETYSFDLAEVEKKPYHLGGYLEAKPLLSHPSVDSALYRLKYWERDLGGSLEEANLKLQPVYDHINAEFGKNNYLNAAGKLYLLLYDTDIDFLFLTGGSRTSRFGADFSRNVTTNWEIHGEIAYVKDFRANLSDPAGKVVPVEYDATSFLLGTRYLTARDTTYILEYYRNGTGFSGEEMGNFFSFIGNAYRTYVATGNDAALQKAALLSEGNYGRPNPQIFAKKT